MRTNYSTFSLVASLVGVAGVLMLSGCSANFGGVSNSTTETAIHIQGSVHGGQQPLVGAHVYMYAGAIYAYGGNGIPTSSNNASTSLLTPATGNTDSNGHHYVITDAQGDFNINGDFVCAGGSQVYLYSTGGDPQLGGIGVSGSQNPAASLLAVVGNCVGSTNSNVRSVSVTPNATVGNATTSPSLPGVTFVTMNEVSTVAAAYALAGFATDPLHIGTSNNAGNGLSETGIANAVNTALNIVDQVTGLPTATTTATGSTGKVPVALINSLADILAVCVNSTGPNSSGCSTLFSNAQNSAGIAPTDTAGAAINIAQNPAQNVAALIGTIPSAPPFTPTLTKAADFSLAVTYSGLNVPYGVAVDGLGNVVVTNSGTTGTNANSVTRFSPTGVPTNFTDVNLNAPLGVAIDDTNTAWVVNSGPGGITNTASGVHPEDVGGTYYLTSINGSSLTDYSIGGALIAPHGVSVGAAGDIWIANTGANNVIQFAASANTSNTFAGIASPQGIAADISGSTNEELVTSYQATGTRLTEFNTSTPVDAADVVEATLTTPLGVAVGQGGNIFVVNAVAGGGTVSQVAAGVQSLGTALISSNFDDPQFIVFDGANNCWTSNLSNGAVTLWNRTVVSTGVFSNYTAGGTISGAEGIAVDGSGNVWVANSGNNTVSELIGIGAPVVTPLESALKAPYSEPAAKP